MYPKPSIVPPGGFHYVEKHAGSEIRLQGDSVDNLARILERYRLNNGIPLDDPRQNIIDYICGNWPHFCNRDTPGPLLEGRNPGSAAGLAIRAAAWVTRLWNLGPTNFVPKAEADRRANLCLTCPMNRDFRAGGCSSCVQGVDRLAFLWLAGRTVSEHTTWHSLRACRATGAHLQASVFADNQPPMSNEEQVQLDPRCWRIPPK